MPGALEGTLIIEWTQFVHGSASMLGDMGAEVIHIEDRVKGDASRGTSAMWGDSIELPGGRNMLFEGANRSKKSLTLDLKTEKGKEVLFRLVKKADIFLHNYRPSVAKRVGLDYASLAHENQRLIYVLASGYGSKGPWSEKRAFDPICQALSGIMWAMGDRDFQEPVQISGAIFDVLGSIMTCYGIMAALLHREKTGMGQELEVSQLGSALDLMSVQLNGMLWLGHSVARHSRSRARNPMANHYRCADNKWLMLAEPQSDRFWPDFCGALDISDIEKDPRFANSRARRENYKEMNAFLDRKFLEKTRDEWISLFDQKQLGFAYAPVLTSQEVVNHPQVLANEYVIEHDHPTMDRARSFNSAINFSKTPLNFYPAPEFGQHTEEILSEICGYSWDEIGQMRVEEVI